MQSLLEGGMKENMPTVNLVRKISLGQPNFGAAPSAIGGNAKAGLSGLAEFGMLARVNSNNVNGGGGSPQSKKHLSLSSVGGVSKTTQQSPKKSNPSPSPMLMGSPTRKNAKTSPVRGGTPQRNALAKQLDELEKEKAQLESEISEWRKKAAEALEAQKERDSQINQLQQQIQALHEQQHQAHRELAEVREQLRQEEESKLLERAAELSGVQAQLEVNVNRCRELEQQQKEAVIESEANFRGIVAAERRLGEAAVEKEDLKRQVDSLLRAQKKYEELGLENEKTKETMEAELFYYQAIASKLDLMQSGRPCNTSIDSLYEMAKLSNIPRHFWPTWIPKQLSSLSAPLPSVPLASLSASSASSRHQPPQPRGKGKVSSRRK